MRALARLTPLRSAPALFDLDCGDIVTAPSYSF